MKPCLERGKQNGVLKHSAVTAQLDIHSYCTV